MMNNRNSLEKRTRLGRNDFEVETLLGEGALCRVYLAHNIHNDQRVAMKVIQKQKITSNNVLQMILSERKILSLLDQHPNVIWLVCTFQDEAYLYFVLDYVTNGSLADTLLRYNHQINSSLAFYWACDMVNILTYLRSKRIVHRDIKTDNLMLDEHNRLRLIDFNSATISENDSPIHLDEDVQALGTLPYLPPELMYRISAKLFRNDPHFKSFYSDWIRRQSMLLPQLEECSPYAADVWSAGCVIFEIFCGYHPFRGTTELETVFNVLEYRINIPESLSDYEADLLRGMLNPIPEERLGADDISELRDHFLFAGVDLESIVHLTERPSIATVPSASASSDLMNGPPTDIYEFTPDIGCSFGGIAPGLTPDSFCDPSAATQYIPASRPMRDIPQSPLVAHRPQHAKSGGLQQTLHDATQKKSDSFSNKQNTSSSTSEHPSPTVNASLDSQKQYVNHYHQKNRTTHQHHHHHEGTTTTAIKNTAAARS